MKFMTRRSSLVTFLLLSVTSAVSGCAAMRGMSARHAYMEAATEKHVYERPLNEVWPQARALLFEKGFEVKDTDATNAETEWKVDSSGKERVRYLLSGIAVGDDKCQVQFMKAEQSRIDKTWTDPDTERDLELEQRLIEKVEPSVYKQMTAEADAEAEKAKQE